MAAAAAKSQYLIAPLESIAGSQLPSVEEVLGLLMFRMKTEKKSVREAANCVMAIVMEIWLKARIPTQRKDNILAKILKLHEDFRKVKRHKGRAGAQAVREDEFKKQSKDLFDVAANNALDVLMIEEDKAFLLAQREPGRRGKMGSVDTQLAAVEARAAQRHEQQEGRRQRAEDEANTSMTSVEMESSSTSADDTTGEENEDGVARPPKRSRRATTERRAVKNVITPSVAAALDRTKITDRGAVYVLSAAAHSLGHDVSELNINHNSIWRHRREHRRNAPVALKEELRGGCMLIVHWDGKLMQDLTRNESVERLPILVSGNGTSQLLNVPKLPNGTGSEMAKAVVKALEDWDLTERIGGMSFDTTSSNTGRNNGACVLIEQQLKTDLLYFACRHHVLELLLAEAFKTVMGPTSGPNVTMFKRFQEYWQFIDQSQFETGDSHPDVRPLLDPVEKDWFQSTIINHKGLRDDYRELLELTVIFLGQIPPRGIRFLAPGPMHHARWMSKAIYALKVWMFRSQFKLTVKEEKGLQQIAIFVSRLYAKAWTLAPEAAAAPRHDLQLLKDLTTYMDEVNRDVGKAALAKLQGHLWYLSEELVALAVFDPMVTMEEKRGILNSLHTTEGDESPAKRPQLLPSQTVTGLQLQDMASTNTRRFFQKLCLEDGFLDADPTTWLEREDFRTAAAFVQGIAVVNDHAERGVALIQEYNRKLTKDEEQLQFLLQVVSCHRAEFPDSRKKTIAVGMAAQREEQEH